MPAAQRRPLPGLTPLSSPPSPKAIGNTSHNIPGRGRVLTVGRLENYPSDNLLYTGPNSGPGDAVALQGRFLQQGQENPAAVTPDTPAGQQLHQPPLLCQDS